MYALQRFLKQNHFETVILNYQPIWKDGTPQITSVRELIVGVIMEKRAHKFRKDSAKHLQMTPVCRSVGELIEQKQPETYIAGSDQIWNPKLTHGYVMCST